MSRYVTKHHPHGRTVSVTDNRERPLLALAELPESVRPDFGYYVTGEDAYSPRFVQYRGAWYDTNDTEGLAPHSLAAHGWSTYLTDTFFSGIVFRHFDREGNYLEDTVVVGRYWNED